MERVRAALGLPEPGAAGLLGVVGAAAELLGLQLVAGVPLPVHVSAIESELFGGSSSATFSPAAAAPRTPAHCDNTTHETTVVTTKFVSNTLRPLYKNSTVDTTDNCNNP